MIHYTDSRGSPSPRILPSEPLRLTAGRCGRVLLRACADKGPQAWLAAKAYVWLMDLPGKAPPAAPLLLFEVK